jgi:hypothetical protein
MANQILAGAVFNAGQVIAGVDADNPPYVGPAAEIVVPSEVGNFVTILDSGTMEVTHTLTNPYPNGQNWGMTANSNDRSLYVTGYIDGHPNYVKSTVIYDLDNLSAGHVEPTGGSKVYSNIAFTDGKAFAIVSPDGSHIGRELAEIDPTTLEKISVIPNPSGIASESGFLGGPLFAHGGKVYKGDTDYQGSQNGTSNGKVFVFDAADGSLLQEISSPSTSSNYPDINRFGSNIAVKDSWVAVTGYTTKNASGMSIGSVHVYDANNLGGSPTELFASNDQRFFGSDLAISGDYVFVGSKSEDGSDGRVHVFDMSAGGSLVISLEVADIFHADADMFGSYIVANETHLFVNAPYHRHQTTLEYVGAVHKFAISDLSGSYESALGETNAQFQVSGGLTNFDITDLPVSESSSGGSTSSTSQNLVVPSNWQGNEQNTVIVSPNGDIEYSTDGVPVKLIQTVTLPADTTISVSMNVASDNISPSLDHGRHFIIVPTGLSAGSTPNHVIANARDAGYAFTSSSTTSQYDTFGAQMIAGPVPNQPFNSGGEFTLSWYNQNEMSVDLVIYQGNTDDEYGGHNWFITDLFVGDAS